MEKPGSKQVERRRPDNRQHEDEVPVEPGFEDIKYHESETVRHAREFIRDIKLGEAALDLELAS